MSDAPVSNIPEYTVSDLAGAVKRTLEGGFGRIRVRGEITELRKYGSGHIYFALKDEGAKIKAVVWKFSVPKLGLAPEDGMEVIATGKLSAYGERSEYQLIVERIDYAGAGALLARVEMLRQRLAAEGLFDAARKRALPMLPAVIGVITSAQGAVLQDIRTTILRRFPRPILLWPVPVQGEGAAARIAAAIAGFSALPPDGPIPRPDVLIVARGGGSLEDLMAFNDEAVVRAAAAATIPLIAAVGHETDTTLIDHAADRRAPTPTAAAELAVPARADLIAALQQTVARLSGALNRVTQDVRLRLQRAGHGLPDLPSLLGTVRQRLDDRAQRLALALPALVRQRRAGLVDVERHLLAPTALLAARRATLTLLQTRQRAALREGITARVLPRLTAAPLLARLREARAQLAGLAARLHSVSHHAVLARGYAAVFDAADQPLTSAAAVKPGATLRIAFADGDVRATAARADRRQGALPV